ncbi:HD-GYP domain-containing protein (c-di-GMP phosphodiesterase class II) [Fontibacillus solani]|uniref:HD-GYP domain, c-di-GMP phosphodiesterase class II (Or its inactivated variant) n=2 Tax=Fontibacillus TaxID=995014 RepID=A0A1G7LHJ3_9BACL|nr:MULTISPECIES: HD-GYP domain-containing protein [Fontibacillus]MBA9085904.1 HD-GYP domain-containing protein (c-di-GMP phosphodiesterase class II) [Fontibacillus solani]SDF48938.1 HD-GYP domain, c-di-GMP phosphodiesterase class II (or its inactivated variant) [Fontibacillus panacisegetis]
MASISVIDVKPGVTIANNVYTLMGGLLLRKGKVLLPRDLDILRAFMVEEVEIEDYQIHSESEAAASQESVNSSATATADLSRTGQFQKEYDRMLHLIKSAFQSVLASDLPIYELRHQLENLIKQLKHYNVLTFVPRNMNEYDYLYHHAILSSLTSYILAQWHGLPKRDWMQVAFAGLLHDIGNTKIDPQILYTPRPLTESEVEEMRMHTTYGYQQLRKTAAINEGVRLAALQHHEKMDGSGYPFRLTGEKIHIYARIVAIADIFHAMTLNRRYRKAQSPYLVLEQIKLEAFGKLDPNVVQTFVDKVTQFHNGMRVRLSNDKIGEIVFSDRNHPTRPMVSIQGEIINLMQETQLHIEEVIS